jgi:hypothetical protein
MKRILAGLAAVALACALGGCSAVKTDTPTEATPQIFEQSEASNESGEPVSEATTAAGTDAIVFEDDVLEGLVRDALGIPQGEITAADAAAVTELDFQMQGVDPDQPYIHNLDALRYFVNLTYLGLGYAVQNAEDPADAVDISPLAGLTKLESLQLGGIVINNLGPVTDMKNLMSLTVFGGKQLSDLSPLSGLSKLQALTLNNNAISDLTPLSGLTKLIYLDLEANQIVDVSPLAPLKNLNRLFLQNNPISDYTPIRQIRENLVEWDFDIPAEQ